MVYTVIVSLRVRPDMVDRFLEAMRENSRASRRDEPGCLRFDVVQDNDDSNHFLLYEIYEDEAAFEAHRAAPHFPRWREAAAVCLREHGGQTNTYCTPVFPRASG